METIETQENKIIFNELRDYFKNAANCISLRRSDFDMQDYNMDSLHVENWYVFIKDYKNGNDKAIYNLETKEYATINSNVKINLLDVEEALGKDTIVAINTRVKKDKKKSMLQKAIKQLKDLDKLGFNIQVIDRHYGYSINSGDFNEPDGSFTITITGNKTK